MSIILQLVNYNILFVIIINRTMVNLNPFAMIINFRYKDSLALLILILLAIIIDIIN